MKLTTFLRITGILGFLGFILHLTFPFMPDWKPTFEAMPPNIRFIVTTFFYIQFAFLAGIAYITTFQTKKLLHNPLRESIAILFASFYLIRVVTELTLWGFHFPHSIIILLFCLFPAACYIAILFYPKNVQVI